jgi:hypothetical protein
VPSSIDVLGSVLDREAEAPQLEDARVILRGAYHDYWQWYPSAACRNQDPQYLITLLFSSAHVSSSNGRGIACRHKLVEGFATNQHSFPDATNRNLFRCDETIERSERNAEGLC